MINNFKIQLYSIMLTFLYISGIFISENNQNLVFSLLDQQYYFFSTEYNVIILSLNSSLLAGCETFYIQTDRQETGDRRHWDWDWEGPGRAILVLAQGSLSSLWRCWTTVTTFNKPFFPIKHSLMVDWTLLNWYFLSDWSIAFSLHLAWCYRPHFGAAWGKKLRRVWSLNPHLE